MLRGCFTLLAVMTSDSEALSCDGGRQLSACVPAREEARDPKSKSDPSQLPGVWLSSRQDISPDREKENRRLFRADGLVESDVRSRR
jgi:hypothetical protein